MKTIDTTEIDTLPGTRIKEGDTFRFRCHSGVACFNKCCRNLNMFLYPYDILRLRKNLGMTSGEFIDTHVDVVMRPGNHFPEVLLKMADNEEKTCPFLSDQGCTVYPDRPDACRTFPVEQGLFYNDKGLPEPVVFFKPPDFCEGQNEDTLWTTQGWAEDQEAVEYNKMTRLWSETKAMFHENPWGPEGADGARGKMAFMAAYNPDNFREFIFNSTFLKRFKVKPEVKSKIKRNDAELMKFGLAWIRLTLFGLKSKYISPKK